MRIKLRDAFLCGSVGIVVGVSVLETQLVTVFPAKIIPILLLFSLGLLLASVSSNGKLRIGLDLPPYYICWLLLCVMFLYGLLQKEFLVVAKIYFFMVYALLICKAHNWIKIFWKMMAAFSSLSVISTYFFYVFPNAYAVMVNFYGYYPVGTGSLDLGYCAGISGHYSHNAILISVFIMMMVCQLCAIQNGKGQQKQKNFYFTGISVAMIALLMTGKRGTTVWCAIAVMITLIISYKNRTKGLMWAILSATALLSVFQIASFVVPEVNKVVARFAFLGKDTGSLERMAMWELAFNSFLQAPILGIGFTNFRDLYADNLAPLFYNSNMPESYTRLDAHNVYLQVFCETGVVGGAIYLLALTLMFVQTIRIVRYFINTERQECKLGALCSICLQVYYLTYSLSGNCLYDSVFYFYGIAIALTMTLSVVKKGLIQRDD